MHLPVGGGGPETPSYNQTATAAKNDVQVPNFLGEGAVSDPPLTICRVFQAQIDAGRMGRMTPASGQIKLSEKLRH